MLARFLGFTWKHCGMSICKTLCLPRRRALGPARAAETHLSRKTLINTVKSTFYFMLGHYNRFYKVIGVMRHLKRTLML